MKAAVYTEYGPPEVIKIKEIEKPVPKNNEVLIRVFASSMNRTDCGFRKPEYPLIIRLINGIYRPKITVMGSEFSGVVEEAGKDVKDFNTGDEVFGLSTTKFGTHAEYVCIAESGSIALKPDGVTFEEAAGVCDGLMLALAYIREIDFSKEKKIIINGASGSIGTAGLQLARYFGANITAVCNGKNTELVKSLGAEKVIDYEREDFTKDNEKYDIVFDAVGKSSFFKCKKILKKNGIYFSTELGFMGQNVFLSLLTPLFRKRRVKFPVPKDSKKDIEFFKELLEAGNYTALIDKVYSLKEIVEAAKYVETGGKTGNVVIKIR
ncbi:NAD(P)-dependent alcohol dehydrogenase [Marispirochaeta aestuarii]|uniref:NAD(P)-dependent alcohol dehydrogenase n=1 Tax=Marispirochaeta aestuarii TaxID=1963862 RepID=UPI0029C71890|nr:NAD(P)-dependent alcohol dehydrogenase [Marispirochaeta aestuarii]